MAAKTIIQDPILSEFLFDAVAAAEPKDRAKFNQRQLRATKTAKRTKCFATHTTLDEKMVMLSKLGIGYCLVIGKYHAIPPKKLKALYAKYKDNFSEETVSEVLETGLVVTTDRHITMFLNMLGNICHSDTYMLNRDFHRLGHNIYDWKDDPHPINENVKETQEYVYLLNKFMLNTSMALKEIRGISEIGNLDMDILRYLLGRKFDYVSRDNIDVYFKQSYKKTVITAAVKRLVEASLIEKSPLTNDQLYCITSLGIDTTFTFMRKVIAETLNY